MLIRAQKLLLLPLNWKINWLTISDWYFFFETMVEIEAYANDNHIEIVRDNVRSGRLKRYVGKSTSL